MDTSPKTLDGLFRQLGLPDDKDAIDQFILTHRADFTNLPLWEAPFWTSAQADFLKQAWDADADWVEIVDELAALLHHP
jgi:hypothetical protein